MDRPIWSNPSKKPDRTKKILIERDEPTQPDIKYESTTNHYPIMIWSKRDPIVETGLTF
jgi:hypothetical protein